MREAADSKFGSPPQSINVDVVRRIQYFHSPEIPSLWHIPAARKRKLGHGLLGMTACNVYCSCTNCT
jgi:hypothetical protein